MKDCVRFAPMLDAREGELSREDAAALAAHLDACARCRAEKADLEATAGLVADALMARANARDFAPFVDQVMARVGAGTVPSESLDSARPERSRAAAKSKGSGRADPRPAGFLAWFAQHRRAAIAAIAAPVLAAAAVLMYVRHEGGPREIAQLEVTAEGDATMVLQTSDGPVVLLSEGQS